MRSRNPSHYLMYMNLILFLILLLEIGFYFWVFPQVAMTKIELDSDLALSDEDVQKLLDFRSPRHYYSVDTHELEQHAGSFALVDDIQISKEFPNLLKVRLRSRKPVLVMLQKTEIAMGEGSQKKVLANQSTPILVDAKGIMFYIGLSGHYDVPVLSGLEFSQGSPLNSRLPSRLSPLVSALGKLKQGRPELYKMISEVRVKMGLANVETDIYLENAPSYIKTSGKIDAHTIETALITMEVLQRGKESTEYLDMRTTGIVYHSGESGKDSKRNL
ncbi:MAG: FtsQ-type POTRA domain-containing protein [Spirochaetota bacterium]